MEDIRKGLQTVVNKAWENAQFKSELVANPKGAIQSATGLNVPDEVKIVVNDQTDSETVYLNIPPKPDFDSMELTDEQLEQVAGGELIIAASILAGITASAMGATSVGVTVNEGRRKKGKKSW